MSLLLEQKKQRARRRAVAMYKMYSAGSNNKKDRKDTALTLDKIDTEADDAPENVATYCFELLNSMVEGDSALHVAVVNNDLAAVKLLVSKGADVNSRVTHNLFIDASELLTANPSKTAIGKYAAFGYYGEYPLSFAAVFSLADVYDYLLKVGADPDNQDSEGNTVLHMIIIYNQLDMFSYAMRHPKKRANPWLKNNDGLTAISLCAKLGHDDMFNEIMELSRVELWKFSNLECSLYPLASVDTIGPGGKTENESALMLMLRGEEEGHLKMLHHEVLQQVINEKWRVFAKMRFLQRMTLIILHCLCLSGAVYLRPKDRSLGYQDYRDAIRYILEVTILLGSGSTFLMHINEVKTVGLILFIINLKNSPSKVFMLFSCLMIQLIPSLRIGQIIAVYGHHDDYDTHDNVTFNESVDLPIMASEAVQPYLIAEEAMFALAAPTSWVFGLFFLKIHPSFGPIIITFYRMVAQDVAKVMTIFSIFWIGFAAAFYYLYKDSGNEVMDSFDGSIMAIFQLSFGSFEYKSFEETKLPWMTIFLAFLVMLLMPVLLLNMLIATMGNTFNRIVNRSKLEWFSQYAKTVITLERAFKPHLLDQFQKQYTTYISSDTRDSRYAAGPAHLVGQLPKFHLLSLLLPDLGNQGYLRAKDKGEEIRAIQVLKLTSSTKASATKRSLKNWRWIYKAIRQLVKARRMELDNTPRRITFDDLFGSEEMLDSDYIREKMVAQNQRKLNIANLLRESNDEFDLSQVAKNALFSNVAKAPTKRQASMATLDRLEDEIVKHD